MVEDGTAMDALASMFYRKKNAFETSPDDNAANTRAIESGHSFGTRIQHYTDIEPEVSADCEQHVTRGAKRQLERDDFARKRVALGDMTNANKSDLVYIMNE